MIVNKFTIHYLDKNIDKPILNDSTISVDVTIDAFCQKILRKVLRDDYLRKAKFGNYNNNIIKKLSDTIMYSEKDFISASQMIAEKFHEVIKYNAELDSCDLAIMLFTHKDQKSVAIIKLDFKSLYTNDISASEEDGVSINMLINNTAITDSQKVIHACIINPNGVNDEWHLQVLDKIAEKQGAESSFISQFLIAEKVLDEKFMTKTLKQSIDAWLENSYAMDVKKYEDAKHVMSYTLADVDDIHINALVDGIINDEDEEKKESLKELLNEKGLPELVPLDATWLEKKLKKRKVKTNTGFVLNALSDDFSDPMKYSIRKNENGTYDIVLKNIEFVVDK